MQRPHLSGRLGVFLVAADKQLLSCPLPSDVLHLPLPSPAKFLQGAQTCRRQKLGRKFVSNFSFGNTIFLSKGMECKRPGCFLGKEWSGENITNQKLISQKIKQPQEQLLPTPPPLPAGIFRQIWGWGKGDQGRRSKNSLKFRTLWFRRIHKFSLQKLNYKLNQTVGFSFPKKSNIDLKTRMAWALGKAKE